MPLESPQSPVQHLRHRVSGFSIPGRLPCLLAVVLGLFAHSEALAQRLDTLELTFTPATAEDSKVLIDVTATPPVGSPNTTTYNVTVSNAVTGVSVSATARNEADADEVVETTYDGASAHDDPLPAGRTTINVKVTVTSTADPAEPTKTQNYVIQLTRTPDATLESLGLTFNTDGGFLTGEALDPAFDPDTSSYTAIVTEDTTEVTVAVSATSPTAEAIAWDRGPTGSSHTRNLGTGLNTITATVRDGTSTGKYTITVTKTDFPGAPRSLRATARNVGKEVALSWSAPSDDGDAPIVGYQFAQYDQIQLEADTDNEFNDDELTWSEDLGKVLSHRVIGLHNGRTYYFRVRAHNENGPGNGSNDDSDTPAGPPLAPTSLGFVAGNARVELTWVAPMDTDNEPPDGNPISSYEYSQNGSWRPIPNSDESTTSYTVTGLNNGTTYQFRVRAKNRAGNGLPSAEVRAVPRSGVPGAPTGLTAQAGDEEVTLSWSAPGDTGGEPITGYEYSQATESGAPPTSADRWTATRGTGTTFTVTSLPNGETYYFRVRARNDNGASEASEEAFATLIRRPEAPAGLETDAPAHGGEVKLTWTASGGIETNSKYQYRQHAGTGSYGNWMDIPNSDASTTSYTVTRLNNGTTYTFQVRAVNLPDWESPASQEARETPATTPGAPTLRATAGDEQMTLSWTAPSDDGGAAISHYRYEVRRGADDYMPTTLPIVELGERFPNSGASTRTHTFAADDEADEALVVTLANETAYTFRVWAVNAVNSVPGAVNQGAVNNKSNPVTVTPSATPGTGRTFDISATIDGKSWAEENTDDPIQVVVTVNPAFDAPETDLYVGVNTGSKELMRFLPGDTTRSESISSSGLSVGTHTVALFPDDEATTTAAQALKVTEVYIRAANATPETPASLRGTAGDGYVTLSWTASSNPENPEGADDRYEYHQKAGTGPYGNWRRISNLNRNGASRSHRVTGLTSGAYTFQVRAVRGTAPNEIPSEASNEDTVTLGTTAVPPGAPTNVVATPGNAQVTLSWSAPADGGAAISRYEYKQETTSGGNLGRWTTTGGTGTTYTVTGLTNGTPYYFQVRAVNRVGDGPASVVASTTPSPTDGTTLRVLSLATVTLAPAPVALTPAFTPATRTYTAAVGSSVTQVAVTATPNKAGATATITPADANTTAAGHQVALVVGPNPIRVSVADGTNAGVYTITVTRAGSVPAAPTGLTATGDAEGAVTLSWTAPTGGGAVSGYEYQQKAGTGAYGAWTPIPGSGPSTTSHIVTGLTNGTAYAFRVRAVNSTGAGAASNEATVTSTTGRLVWAKSEQEVAAVIAAAMAAGSGDDMTLDAGEQIEILGSALFNAAEGVTLSYTAVSSNSDVASAGIIDTVTLTVTARAGGMADITITATASLPSGVTINPQTSPREASIMFPVEVDIEALVLELVGPTDMNLVEGGSNHANGTAGRATVRVQANRPVTREVTVTLMADRAMGDATADDFEADPIVIEAGETRGSTVVIAVEDGTAEDREVLVLFGMAADNAGEVQGEVTLHLFDAAVPALPLVAQLLLAAFLAIGGYRRYRRR